MTTLKEVSIATAASLVTSIASIIGAAFYIDARYAHADDISSVSKRQDEWARTIIIQQNRAIDNMRKQTLEDKLFELEQKERPSTVDRALIQRYERELSVVNTRLGND